MIEANNPFVACLRFYERLELSVLFGGRVEQQLPVGPTFHSSRLFNRRLRRARLHRPLHDVLGDRRNYHHRRGTGYASRCLPTVYK